MNRLTAEEYTELEERIKNTIHSYIGCQNTRSVREELQDRLYNIIRGYGLDDELRIGVVPPLIGNPDTYNDITLVGGNSFSDYFLWKIIDNG